MIITYHNHGGYYGDGNSHYWTVDSTVDFSKKIKVTIKEDTYGGQLQSGNSDTKETIKRKAKLLTVKKQKSVLEILKPFVDLAVKYPHRENFQFFSIKQKYFFKSRLKKARELTRDFDNHGVNCSVDIFVLPVEKKVVKIYPSYEYDGYTCRNDFRVTLENF